MNSEVCAVLRPDCRMRTCHKKFLDPIAGPGKQENMSVWSPVVSPEEGGGHGGRSAGGLKRCSEKFPV